MANNNSDTPRGTPPYPVRVNTKHKRPAYGEYLMQKHSVRKVMRTEKKAKLAADLTAKASKPTDQTPDRMTQMATDDAKSAKPKKADKLKKSQR